MQARTFSRPTDTASARHRQDSDGSMAAGSTSGSSADAFGTDVQSLRAELEQGRRILDSATDYAVVTMNMSGQITGWNAGARSILGYGDADILGRSGEVFFPAEDRARGVFPAELRRAMQFGCALNERWHLRHDGTRFWASGSMMPLRDEDGRAIGYLNMFRDNSIGRAEEERRALLLAEMGHRLKNLLATVQAVARQTFRGGDVPQEVQDDFDARLLALARSHDLLIQGDWEGAPLAELVERAVAPYGGQSRATVSGPSVQLPANTVEMLCLAFHELATNAAKHGALSVPEGRVDVCWTVQREGCGTCVVDINWREHDGPPVIPPAGRGFGSRLLEQGLMQSFGGTVQLRFEADGLRCSIRLPTVSGADMS